MRSLSRYWINGFELIALEAARKILRLRENLINQSGV
jgi:hypothetical protein